MVKFSICSGFRKYDFSSMLLGFQPSVWNILGKRELSLGIMGNTSIC